MGVAVLLENHSTTANTADHVGLIDGFELERKGVDEVEVVMTSASGRQTRVTMTVATMLQLVSACSALLNTYNVSTLRDLGIL